jgi:hypothetical protein
MRAMSTSYSDLIALLHVTRAPANGVRGDIARKDVLAGGRHRDVSKKRNVGCGRSRSGYCLKVPPGYG